MRSSCRVFALLVIAMTFGLSIPIGPPLAQVADEKSQLVQEIVDLHKAEKYLERVFESAVRAAPAEQQELFKDIYSRLDQDEIYADLAESIDQLYTTEELKAYLEFASTEVGRSILRKKTEMSEKLYEALALEVLKAMTDE